VIVNQNDLPDIYLQLCYSFAAQLRTELTACSLNTPIVSGANTGWLREGPREGIFHWDALYAYSDWIVFNSRAAWGISGRQPQTSYISNGVDREDFHVKVPIKQRQIRCLALCSTYHTEKHRDIKGWHSVLMPLKEALERMRIPCNFLRVDSSVGRRTGRPTYSTDALLDFYNSGTIYVVASQSEGTPNPALEAAACGCTIVSSCVGNMPELIRHGINGLIVTDRTVEAYVSAIKIAVDNYAAMADEMQTDIQEWDWRNRARSYYALFDQILAKRKVDKR